MEKLILILVIILFTIAFFVTDMQIKGLCVIIGIIGLLVRLIIKLDKKKDEL